MAAIATTRVLLSSLLLVAWFVAGISGDNKAEIDCDILESLISESLGNGLKEFVPPAIDFNEGICMPVVVLDPKLLDGGVVLEIQTKTVMVPFV